MVNALRWRAVPLVLAALLAVAGIATAQTTWTVCPAGAPTCNYATIQAAITAAAAGDSIQIGPGTYHEQIRITKSLALHGADGAVIDGTPTLLTPPLAANAWTTGVQIKSGNVTWDNIDVTNFTQDGIIIGYEASVPGSLKNVHVTSSKVSNIQPGNHGFGIYAGYQSEDFKRPAANPNLKDFLDYSGLLIEGNEIANTHSSAVVIQSITGTPGTVVVRNNYIHDGQNDGIWIDCARNIEVSHNRIARDSDAIYLSSYAEAYIAGSNWQYDFGVNFLNGPYGPKNISITGNELVDSTSYGGVYLEAGYPAAITFSTNLITGNSPGVGNYLSASVNAAYNWWGAPTGPTPEMTVGPVVTEPWIAAYTDDPAMAGKPGFWPIDMTLQPAPATFPLGDSIATPTGSSIQQTFTDPATGASASVTFDTVTGTGGTTVTAVASGQPGYVVPPAGLPLGTTPIYFDITTTASYTPPVAVCLTYPGANFTGGILPAMFHYEGGAWVNVTTSVNATTHTVCGSLSSLSPVLLAQPQVTRSGSATTYSTIQAAIDAASAGETITVPAGTFAEWGLLINKTLTLRSAAGAGATVIDGSGSASATTILAIRDLAAAAVVTVDGFTIRTGPATSVASNGILVYNNASGSAVTLRNNVIYGTATPAAAAEDNFPLIVQNGGATSSLVVEGNVIHGGVSNTILLERWQGPVTISGNTIYRSIDPVYTSSAIFAMTYGGKDVTGTQLIDGNTFVMGGINVRSDLVTYSSAYNYNVYSATTAGGYSDVRITNNTFAGIDGYTRGIILWNDGTAAHGPISATLTGNSFQGAAGLTAVRVTGLGITADVENNDFTGEAVAFKAFPYNAVPAPDGSLIAFRSNSIAPASTIDWSNGAGTLGATLNWWGQGSGPAGQAVGSVTTSPFIAAYTDDPAMAGKPGFWPIDMTLQPAPATYPLGASIDTGTGAGVTLAFSDPASGVGVSVGFGSVTAAGPLAVTALLPGSLGYVAPPAGLPLGTTPIYFDITTTASYTPPVAVCLTYPGANFTGGILPAMFHYEGGAWVNVTTSVNATTHTVCGSLSSLSPVLLAQPQVTRSGSATTYSTIQAALDAAGPGETVTVPAGTFPGNIKINKSVTLVGDPSTDAPGPGPLAPVIDGGNVVVDAFDLANGVSNVSITGFEVRNLKADDWTDGTGVGVQAWVPSTTNVTVSHNWFHDVGYGVMAGNDGSGAKYALGTHTGWTVSDNIAERVYSIAFELTDTSSSSIRNNVIHLSVVDTLYGFSAIGVFSWNHISEHDLTVSGNTIDGTTASYPAIYIYAYSDVAPNPNLNGLVIENNLITSTGTPYEVVIRDIGTGTVTNARVTLNNLPTLNNRTAAAIDAANNWWGQSSGPAAGQTNGTVTSSPWIATYSNDPAMAGKPGFWPIDMTLQPPPASYGFGQSIDTGTGPGVTLSFSDAASGLAATVAFGSVNTSGGLVVTALKPGDPGYIAPPAGYALGTPPVYVDISTTALYTPPVTVCLVYPSGSFSGGAFPAMFHYNGSAWVNVTTSVDVPDRKVCGSLSSLSPIILVQPPITRSGDPTAAYTTIKAAIDAAGSGETVTVPSGTYPEWGLVLNKALTLKSASGAATTTIDGSGSAAATTILSVRDLTAAAAVTVDGFTIRTGPATSVASNGILVYHNASGTAVTLSNNVIYGTATPAAATADNFPLIVQNGDATAGLTLTGNVVHGGASNTMLLEGWQGPVTMTGNTIDRSTDPANASSVIYAMTYGGKDVTATQLIDGNTFQLGGGSVRTDIITFSAAYDFGDGPSQGAYGDVRITNNRFTGIDTFTRGLVFWNDGDAAQGATSAIVMGNSFVGAGGQFGVRITGLGQAITMWDNDFAGEAVALRGMGYAPWGTPQPDASLVRFAANSIPSGSSVDWADGAGTLDATRNWWSVGTGPAGQTVGSVTSTPWIASYADDPVMAGKPGFWPDLSTQTAITTISPDPSTVNLGAVVWGTVTVVTRLSGPAVLPGSVTVSDGATCSDDTLVGAPTPGMFAFSCRYVGTTPGAKTLSATYADSTSFYLGSVGTASHTVTDTLTAVTVTADTAGMTFGGTPTTLSYKAGGFVNSDTFTTAPSCFAYALLDTAFETPFTPSSTTPAGSYVVHCGGAVAPAGYGVSYVDAALTVSQATTTISIDNIPASPVYGGSFTPTYSYTGDGTPSATSTTTGVCTVTTGVVNFVGVGTCTLRAAATAGTNYGAVTGSLQSFGVGQATPTIGINNLPASAAFGGGFTPTYSYTGDGTPSTTSTTTGICTVTSGVVNFVGIGTCTLRATATAGTNYAAATGSLQSFSIGQASPTISINNIPASAVYGGSFTPTYTYTGDGTPSTTSTTTGVCTVTSGIVNFVGVGTCTLRAAATAGTNYTAVTGSLQSFGVGQTTPSVSVSNIPGNAVYGGSFFPAYSYTGDGTPSVTSGTPGTCSVVGNMVRFVGAGTCTLTAKATAGVHSAAVTGNPQSFGIARATTTIDIANIPWFATFGGSFTPMFDYHGDGTPSAVSTTPATCTVTGNLVKYVGVGTCTLKAQASAGDDYAAVTGNPQSFTIAKLSPTIGISNVPTNAVYGGSFTPAYSYAGDGTPSVTSSTTTYCTVSGGAVNFIKAGICTLTARATGTANSNAAVGKPQSFTIGRLSPTISISNIPANAAYGGKFTPTFAYNGDDSPKATSNTPTTCSVSLGVVSFIKAGTCTLTPSATATANSNAVTGSPQSFTIAKLSPTIDISNIPAGASYGGSFTPSFDYHGDGTTSVASSTTGVCKVAGTKVSFVGVGTCTLTPQATAGTNSYAVTGDPQSFTVAKAKPTITIKNIPTYARKGGSFTPAFTYTGDDSPYVTSSTPSVCTVSGTTVKFVNTGTCSLTAHASETAYYLGVDGKAQPFTIFR